MVFGDKKGGGLGGIKRAVGDEGAISERMRLSHITKLKEEEEAKRAKSSLVEKRRLLDRNKTEISHRQTEIRRLDQELTRAEAAVTLIENEMKGEEEKVGKLMAKYNDLTFQINQEREKMGVDKSKVDNEMQTLHHYQDEIKAIELRMMREKDLVRQAGQDIEKITVKMAHLTNDANRMHTDFLHANSQKQYREREKENRRRALSIVTSKKEHEASEIHRLESENTRLEQEIKSLEQKSHQVV